MAEIGLGGEQYEQHEESPKPGLVAPVSESTRQGGITELKRRMGGDTPWYKERGPDLNTPYGRANIGNAMGQTYDVDRKVPRRKED